MSRKKIVAGNWKMNKNLLQGLELISEAMPMIQDELHREVLTIFIPPFTHLDAVGKLIKSVSGFSLGAQNFHPADEGAFTGEVSAAMLNSVGAKYVLIGHSERRTLFGEDEKFLKAKLDQALKHELIGIFCIGESLQEREEQRHFQVVKQQLEQSVFHLTELQLQQVVIAYEPVWAIGTGKTASPEQAQEMHQYIRQLIAERYSENAAAHISILYGGSCNPGNATALFSMPDIDGGLIGGASLKSRDFTSIVTSFNSIL